MGSLAANHEYYPITGIKRGFGHDGEVPMRMEIDEWWNSDDPVHVDQVSLFIAALKEFQNTPISEKLSYFQIAGIHSEPKLPWDEGGVSKRRDNEYCQHEGNLFPTWHRPYLLLFEQCLYQIMVETIIGRFPTTQRTSLQHAAEKWRLPFWDWAMKKPVMDAKTEDFDNYDVPQLVRLEAVRIRTPQGLRWVKNPLYTFKMPGNVPMSTGGVEGIKNRIPEIRFEQCVATSRYPPTNQVGKKNVSEPFIEGYQDNDSVMRRLRDFTMPADDKGTQARSGVVTGGNLTASLREAFYRVVTMEDYEMFSTKKRLNNTKVEAWGSAESLHDKLHLWCGGGYFGEPAHGHMSWVPVAAFDPIFWLHHNNVDRLFAIWQTLHPKGENKKNWFADKARAQEDLLPFRKNKDGEYWNSDDVYETADLGYTYSILPKKRDAAGKVVLDRTLDELDKELNDLYGATRRAEQKAAVTGVQPKPLKVADALQFNTITKIQAQIIDTATATPEAPKVEDQLDVYDYIANVKYERFALQGMPFTIHVLIGKAPENDTPIDAVEYKNVVGQVFNFVAPLEYDNNSNDNGDTTTSGGCVNCKKQAEEKSESTGQVVLTNALITRYKQQIIHENRDDASQVLASMEPADVIEFLKKNLHWRITGATGSIIPKEQIPSLKVAIAVGKADHYADPTKLSVYRDYEVMYDVTAGRAGGAAPEDNLFAPGTEYHG